MVVISLMKLAHMPMTATKEANCMARMAVKVTPKAPSWGAWKRILGVSWVKSVISSREGRSLVAVLRGKCGFGNGLAGGGGK